MRQECHCKVKDVLYKRDGLQLRLEWTASELSVVRNSLMAVRERIEQHCRLFSAGHLRLEPLLVTPDSSFVDMVACLVSDEMAAHWRRLQMSSLQRLTAWSWYRSPL